MQIETINKVWHTACEMDINTNTEPDNNAIHEAVEFYWGERCPEYEEGCATCAAWKLYDKGYNAPPEGML